jgi:hypothetical protein
VTFFKHFIFLCINSLFLTPQHAFSNTDNPELGPLSPAFMGSYSELYEKGSVVLPPNNDGTYPENNEFDMIVFSTTNNMGGVIHLGVPASTMLTHSGLVRRIFETEAQDRVLRQPILLPQEYKTEDVSILMTLVSAYQKMSFEEHFEGRLTVEANSVKGVLNLANFFFAENNKPIGIAREEDNSNRFFKALVHSNANKILNPYKLVRSIVTGPEQLSYELCFPLTLCIEALRFASPGTVEKAKMILEFYQRSAYSLDMLRFYYRLDMCYFTRPRECRAWLEFKESTDVDKDIEKNTKKYVEGNDLKFILFSEANENPSFVDQRNIVITPEDLRLFSNEVNRFFGASKKNKKTLILVFDKTNKDELDVLTLVPDSVKSLIIVGARVSIDQLPFPHVEELDISECILRHSTFNPTDVLSNLRSNFSQLRKVILGIDQKHEACILSVLPHVEKILPQTEEDIERLIMEVAEFS